MPKAKLYKNRRQTKAPRRQQRPRKEDGRPRGTFKKFRFEETRLGFMLQQETPYVFDIIIYLTPYAVIKEPSLELIAIVCKASGDVSFQKKKFARYLEEYARWGLYCKRGRKLTPKREAYYRTLREKKLKAYIQQNRPMIDFLRKRGR